MKREGLIWTVKDKYGITALARTNDGLWTLEDFIETNCYNVDRWVTAEILKMRMIYQTLMYNVHESLHWVYMGMFDTHSYETCLHMSCCERLRLTGKDLISDWVVRLGSSMNTIYLFNYEIMNDNSQLHNYQFTNQNTPSVMKSQYTCTWVLCV